MRAFRNRLVFAIALLVLPCSVSAQTPVVTSTATLSFSASADHAVVIGGVPKVASYQLDTLCTPVGQPTPVPGFSLSLGKPTPDSSNTITVARIPNFGTLPEGVCTASVSAIGGGGGIGKSPASDPFVFLKAPSAAGKPGVAAP